MVGTDAAITDSRQKVIYTVILEKLGQRLPVTRLQAKALKLPLQQLPAPLNILRPLLFLKPLPYLFPSMRSFNITQMGAQPVSAGALTSLGR